MDQCTFQPTISNNNLNAVLQNNKSVNNTKGFDSFYRRQMIAKQEKERKEQILTKNSSEKKSNYLSINKKRSITKAVPLQCLKSSN